MYGHAEDLKILGFYNFMERLGGIPHTRQRSSEGHRRLLPNLGATGAEIGRVRLNGRLTSDVSPETLREYLLDPTVYGLPRTPRKDFRGPGFRLPIDDLS